MVFENIAGYTAGRPALVLAEKKGADVAGAFRQYAQTHTRAKFLPQDADGHSAAYAAAQLGGWLIDTKRYDACKPLAAAVAGADETVVSSLASYFVEAGCAAANPLALDLLSSNNSNTRVIACNMLAQIGDSSDLPKVKVIADTDTATTILADRESGTAIKTFPVAEACKAAVGKIQLRGG